MWSTAVPDWEERLLAGRSLVPQLPLFADERDRALRIFDRLKLPDVIGQPRMADAAGDWFRDIVAALFGSYDNTSHRRMIQELFLLVPKKNGKSSYAAAIMVVAMIVNRRPLAEYLLIAPTMKIADHAYRQAKGIINADEELRKLFHLIDHQKTIRHLNSEATLSIKAADTDVITGSKSVGILVDETHEFAKKAKAAEIFLEVRGGLAARPDGFMIQITTQSKEPPQGVMAAELAIARKVRDGEIRLPRLAVLYELPAELAAKGGWKDERLWGLVNPNLGRSVDPEFLRNQLLVAEEGGPAALALLASQHFNVQVGLSLHMDRWRGADYWLAAIDADLQAGGLDNLIARSEVAVVGIDGGGLDDLLGLTVIGRDRQSGDWLTWSHAWCQDNVLELRKDIEVKLLELEAAGQLTINSSPRQEEAQIAALVKRLLDAGLLPAQGAIGLDAVGVAAIVAAIHAIGVAPEQFAAIVQGFKLNGAIKGAERMVKDRQLRHGGQALMTWCVGNAKTELRGSALLITKQVSGSAKIDPLAALFDAFELMSRNPVADGQGVPEIYFV